MLLKCHFELFNFSIKDFLDTKEDIKPTSRWDPFYYGLAYVCFTSVAFTNIDENSGTISDLNSSLDVLVAHWSKKQTNNIFSRPHPLTRKVPIRMSYRERGALKDGSRLYEATTLYDPSLDLVTLVGYKPIGPPVEELSGEQVLLSDSSAWQPSTS